MQLSQLSMPEIGIGSILTVNTAGIQDQAGLTSDAFAPIIDNKLQLTQPASEPVELNIKMLLDAPEVAKQIKELLLSNGQSGTNLTIPKDVLTNLLSLTKADSQLETEVPKTAMIAITNIDTASLIDTFKQQLEEKLKSKFSDILSKEDIEKIISEVTSNLTEDMAPTITKQVDNSDVVLENNNSNIPIADKSNLELTNSLLSNMKAKVRIIQTNMEKTQEIDKDLNIKDQLQAVKTIIDSNNNNEMPVTDKTDTESNTELIESISNSLMPIINNSMVEKVSVIKTESNSVLLEVKEKSGKTESIMLNQICSTKQNNTTQTGTILLNSLTVAMKKTLELTDNISKELPKIEVNQKLLQDSLLQQQEANTNPIQSIIPEIQPEQHIVSTESTSEIKLDEVVTKVIEEVEKKIDLSGINTSNKKISSSELEKIIVSIKEETLPVVKLLKDLSNEENLVVKITKEPNIQRNILPEIPLKSITSSGKNNSNNSIDSLFSDNSQKNILSRIDRSININKINPDNINNALLLNNKKEIKADLINNLTKENILGEGTKKQEKFKFDFVSFNNNGNNISNFLLSSSMDPLNSTNRIMNSNIEVNNRSNVSNTNIVDQVLEKMKFNSGKTELSIQLNPYDLGKVDVSVSLQRGSVVAHMVAETAKAAESLKSGMDNLKQSLSESGINVDKIVITSADKSSFSGNNNDSNPNNSKDNWSLHQNNGNNNHQQEKQNFKDSFDLSNFKNNSDSREKSNNSKENTENTSTKQDNLNSSNNSQEENFINSDKGIVNYRV